jgi:hypothetical protein
VNSELGESLRHVNRDSYFNLFSLGGAMKKNTLSDMLCELGVMQIADDYLAEYAERCGYVRQPDGSWLPKKKEKKKKKNGGRRRNAVGRGGRV